MVDPLGTLPSVFNTTELCRHHRSFVHTEPPHGMPLNFLKTYKDYVLSKAFHLSCHPVYPHLKRIALVPKLHIVFRSTATCLSNLGRKAAKNNYYFLTCLDLCLSRVLSNNSKWKLRQIWKWKRPYRGLTVAGVRWQGCSEDGV